MSCSSLSAEGAALIGAAIGGASTIVGNIVTHWLANRRSEKLDVKRKARLRTMLTGDEYVWRSIGALSSAIGADKEKTASLLIEIDARQSISNNDSWALVSRRPFPDDMQPAN
jgi:hypothetical protein